MQVVYPLDKTVRGVLSVGKSVSIELHLLRYKLS